MKRFKRILSLILAVFFLTGFLIGCSQKTGETQGQDTQGTPQESKDDPKSSVLIAKKPITLKYWFPFTSTIIKSLSENAVYQELEKRTGIKMEFIHPPAGQTNEQFNLVIASNDLPDLFQNPPAYPGGPDKAVADKVYLKLNDLIDKHAPNYKKAMNYNDDIRRQTRTDEGSIWAFSCIQLTEEPPWAGPIIRKDWLDELGIKMPATIDEWYTALKAFKDKKGAEAPLLFIHSNLQLSGAFAGAFGINRDFMNVNGKVKFGPIEPGFKEFLITLNKWYAEGLIDKDFATRDGKSVRAMFTSGKGGAISQQAYGDFGPMINSGIQTDPKFTLAATPMPALKPGDKLHFRQTNPYVRGYQGVITTACKYPVEAAKWFDYAYTDEGHLLYCYGIEGLTYRMVEGKPGFDAAFFPDSLRNANRRPEFTELMTKNPDKLDFWDLVPKYKVHVSAFLRNPMAYGTMRREILDGMEIWGKAGNDYVMPPIILTDQENRRFSAIMSEVDTYLNEMMLKFIMGIEPISRFDQYVNQIGKLGIEEAIKIQQAALERYFKR